MNWIDRMTEKPRTFTVQNNSDGTITLIPAFGLVLQEGVPINAANLNKTEKEISDHAATKAATTQLGHVIGDGDTITINNGVISVSKRLATGTYSDTSTSVPANSTYTLTIPLGFAAKSGKIIMKMSPDTSNADYQGLLIHFTTDNSQAHAVYAGFGATFSGVQSMAINSFIKPVWLNYFKITQCYISGNNLIITFANSDTVSDTLPIYSALWEVEG